MKHLGDISALNGAEIEPVDIITFGSPCQDLSMAGKRAGLGGDRSGLFREAVRIIKEMRSATNGEYPKFAIWENVPGAFSSSDRKDFQAVLLELCQITEPEAPPVPIPKEGWSTAGELLDVGGGSLAWRVIDAQFHGVPQRRRRIILGCDFRGQRAGEILFEPRGLPGYPAEGEEARQGAAAATENGSGNSSRFATTKLIHPVTTGTLCASGAGLSRPGGMGSETDLIIAGFKHKAGSEAGIGYQSEISPTLMAEQLPAVFKANIHNSADFEFIVRRLTPKECTRLQGFPDQWAELPRITDITDEDFEFWQSVRKKHAEINGKKHKPFNKSQMVKWYNKLHSDAVEYRMWGNGVALPVVRIPIHGMAGLGAKTLGSLFDGSGGFPLAGLMDGIETLWASEIEPYPIAVTKHNFSGRAQKLLQEEKHDFFSKRKCKAWFSHDE